MAESTPPTEPPRPSLRTTIAIRSPAKYASPSPSSSSSAAATSAPLDWLCRTWTVTHSTLSMWAKARNVRITYKALAPSSDGALLRVSDLVEHEALDGHGGVKNILGVDTSASADHRDTGAWNWRGKGWLVWVTSHWEVLGWGERRLEGAAGGGDSEVERWVVTWFAPTLFTKEGIDIYCDRREGLSEETAREVIAALKGLDAKRVAEMVERDIKPVAIVMPWKEK